ncbi:transcriptional regulator [Sulfolobus acidocaldarius]|uniref:Conserved Archaeal protein n=4 Tax=Sulfolobus acidocaldarius TaxID=2285 RepID=Q4J943_SULAC|nr:transcriptional regulator [Sulfolobus acidocaldarius]AHC51618.1 transcriptional regulator [Sulfolobus acidocaldarius SUSAZ]AAY80687.1 conserved Archaeal protein [Sulfolobus acidocaldarius DSM 639]AGE71284.1 hypothetical protein SacN8_06595 [Sulfolobus acidocaldarius N8]AGE73553.1 hypothetical protein SacRon12I_06585 [Sulfolobus acidocaldarius Ron12/I]ALU30665.1 transcriptional regulator [Sulfolobus acidocaldarius]
MDITLPCEYSVKELLPAIRAIIAEKLVVERKISIYKTSELLGVTPAAIENYIKKKRGTSIQQLLKNDREFMDLINIFVNRLVKDGKSEGVASYYCILCTEGKKVLMKNGYSLTHCMVEDFLDGYNFPSQKRI